MHPSVISHDPTGYLATIDNFVPCCSVCNSLKGKKDFDVWYTSPKTIAYLKKCGMSDQDIHDQKELIDSYAKKAKCYGPCFENLLSPEDIEEYKKRRDAVNQKLREEQEWCDKIANKILANAKNSK